MAIGKVRHLLEEEIDSHFKFGGSDEEIRMSDARAAKWIKFTYRAFPETVVSYCRRVQECAEKLGLTIDFRLCHTRENIPQSLIFGGTPVHLWGFLMINIMIKCVESDGPLTAGGSTKSPRGKGSLMNTV